MTALPARSELCGALRDVIGAQNLITGAEEMQPYLIDHRQLYRGRALAVVLPREVEQVCALLAWCNERRIGVVPQGGNTSYCGGATPDESGRQIVLALARLNRIRAIDANDFSMTVEAGCVLAQVQQVAQQHQRLFPLSLGAQGSCQIGGNLATNAGGLNVVRYGMTRDLVLGIEAVWADGERFDGLKSLRKDNTGYDLKSLLIGSEGTLAVITAATLKLWPQTRASATAFVALPSVQAAVRLLGQLRSAANEKLSSFELLPRIAVELTCAHIPQLSDPLGAVSPWYVLCELSSAAEEPLQELLQGVLSAALERDEILDAALAVNERQRQGFWRLRESIPEAQRLAGASLKHDVSVPIGALAEFVRTAGEWVEVHVPEGILVCYGHAGDGSLHFNINQRPGSVREDLLAHEPLVRRAVHDLVARFHGSISAEHGIGQLKREELQRYASPTALQAMRAIKHALDPYNILNPGKLL